MSNKSASVIFDLDGTLFMTTTITVPAMQEAFRENALAH
jgi:beta-phosphoglucomutase-like phosphatase (HAD superfamily)